MGLEELTSELQKPKSLGEQVEEIIREAIIEGTLDPGERLVESQIASQLGLSRTPVRDALQRLERDGLVTTLPSGAAMVTQLSLDDLEDITEVRRVVEPYAAAMATRRMTPEVLTELEGLFSKMRVAAEDGDFRHYVALNDRLHAKVYEASQSPTLVTLIRALNFALYFRQIADFFGPPQLSEMLQEHEEIFDAMRRGDEEVVESVFREHIGMTLQLIREKMAEPSS
jgi:DNA-binding GntR family transcriptional regulator